MWDGFLQKQQAAGGVVGRTRSGEGCLRLGLKCPKELDLRVSLRYEQVAARAACTRDPLVQLMDLVRQRLELIAESLRLFGPRRALPRTQEPDQLAGERIGE